MVNKEKDLAFDHMLYKDYASKQRERTDFE